MELQITLPEGVRTVLAPNPSLMTGPGTNTYLVTEPWAGAVVIDPGPDIREHLDAIVAAAHDVGGVRTILITHGHPDHIEGAASLRALTGAPILAWSREGSPVADETLSDGAVVRIGGRTLRALHTPGHRFDHLCYLLEDARTIFAGDLVAGTGTVVIAPPEGDLLDYLNSLLRLRALEPALMLPAHGPSIDAPRELLDYYIAHREERERQVLDALGQGPASIPELVARIYADVDPALHGVAALSVSAHLLKLEREGRVRRDESTGGDDVWRLVSTPPETVR